MVSLPQLGGNTSLVARDPRIRQVTINEPSQSVRASPIGFSASRGGSSSDKSWLGVRTEAGSITSGSASDSCQTSRRSSGVFPSLSMGRIDVYRSSELKPYPPSPEETFLENYSLTKSRQGAPSFGDLFKDKTQIKIRVRKKKKKKKREEIELSLPDIRITVTSPVTNEINRYTNSSFPSLIAIPESNRVKREEASIPERTSLPPADQRHSLVANSKYTVYNTGNNGRLLVAGEPRNAFNRSLPNSRIHNLQGDSRRHNSAPNGNIIRHTNVMSPRAPLPRINNLVNGKNTSSGRADAEVSKNLVKYRHGRKRRKNKVKDKSDEGAAGVSTKDHDVQTLVSPKFASSWANARVEQVTRSSYKSEQKEDIQSPRPDDSTGGNDSKLNTSRSSKDYPKPWTINAKPPIEKDAKKGDGSLNQSTTNNDSIIVKQQKDTTQNKQSNYQIQNRSIVKHDNSLEEIPENSEVPKKGNVSYPRREKLRMQRAKAQMLEKLRKQAGSQADSQPGEDQGQRRYSNIDAANIYYASVAANIPPVTKKVTTRKDSSINETDISEMDTTMGADTTTDSEGFKKKPKEYVLNKRETAMYLNVRSVYDEETEKYRSLREKRFYKKVEQVQLEKWKQERAEYKKRKQRERDTKERQVRQLKRVRDKFEEEQARRFRNQFVTGKILEHEWQTRQVYGLPDEINSEPQYAAKLKAKVKKPEASFDRRTKSQTNKKRFKRLFKVKQGPRWDPRSRTPKMEGIDTIVLEQTDDEGQTQERKIDVKDIVNEALQALDDDEQSQTQSDKKSSLTDTSKENKSQTKKDSQQKNFSQPKKTSDFLTLKPRAKDDKTDDIDSLDLSDSDDTTEDIFEKARRKYNIDLDSDDDL